MVLQFIAALRFTREHLCAASSRVCIFDTMWHVGPYACNCVYLMWCSCVEQESDEWSEVLDDLPPAIRGRLVSAVLDRSCRQLMAKLGAGVYKRSSGPV